MGKPVKADCEKIAVVGREILDRDRPLRTRYTKVFRIVI